MDIRFCTKEEIPKAMAFLGTHWSAQHILSKNKQLFEFQHLDPQSNEVRFVLALDDQKEIWGCLGLICNSHYDADLKDADTVWLTTWKVRDDATLPGLGLMLHGLADTLPHAVIGTVGNNDKVAAIYQALGYETGELEHFFMINPKAQSQTLLDLPEGFENMSGDCKDPLTLQQVTHVSCSELKQTYTPAETYPKKTFSYLLNRYAHHPSYTYLTYAAVDNEKIWGYLTFRQTSTYETCGTSITHGAEALRLVDFTGDPTCIARLGPALQSVLTQSGTQYLDFFVYGVDPKVLRQAGFTHKPADSDMVVPNYFEPFEKKNVPIRFALKAPKDRPWILVKGDCDQDRPNLEETAP